MTRSQRNKRAKRLLNEAAAHVGPDVVVIAPGVGGEGYFATSMPTKTAVDLERACTMLQETLKKVRSWQRRRRREEQLAESVS